ncbi:MAG: hypothetical protein SF051_08840 [Elusimicrobiota bacterium]|nr:hypothetical protein [Elusimicrobiota bacterium]
MRPLLLALLAAASSASAEGVPVDRDAWHGMNRSVQAYHERYRAAPVEARPVFRLWKRLAEKGQPMVTGEGEDALGFERVAEPDASGAARNRLVFVVRVPEGQSGPVQRAVYTRSFSHMVASSEDWSVGPGGERRVEIWRFVLGLEGTLHSAARQEIVLKNATGGAAGQAEVDETRSRTVPLRPADPAVQARWRALARELLLLGPVIET